MPQAVFHFHGSLNDFLPPARRHKAFSPTVKDRLPHFTRLSYNEFFECQNCSQLYWKGAHYQRIQQLIEQFVG